MWVFLGKRAMGILVFSIVLLLMVPNLTGTALIRENDQKLVIKTSSDMSQPREVIRVQQGGSTINVVFILSAWQYYSRDVIPTVNQTLATIVTEATELNVTLMVIDGNTTRDVLENLLTTTEQVIQDVTTDYIVLFIAPWEDTQVRLRISQFDRVVNSDVKVVFFDSMRPTNSWNYLWSYRFADEEMAFIAGTISSYLASKMSSDVDEIVLYTTLTEKGPVKNGSLEWRDQSTRVSVTGFFQGVLYYDQQFDVTAAPLFYDLDELSQSDYVNQVAANIAGKMQDGSLTVTALRVPSGVIQALTTRLAGSTSNDSVLVVMDQNVSLSPSVPFSLTKNHTILLQQLFNDIRNGRIVQESHPAYQVKTYSYAFGAYSVNYVNGDLPEELKAIIDKIASDYVQGKLRIPIEIATASIQPIPFSMILLALVIFPIYLSWRRKHD